MERRPATTAEAKALAHPLRLRILRVCLDEALTNKEIAAALGCDPGTTLYHVRRLVDTGFLSAEAVRRGTRGSRERPYRATGKSWTLDVGQGASIELAVIDAFRAEVAEAGAGAMVSASRLAVRLRHRDRDELVARVDALVQEFIARDHPRGESLGIYVGIHRRRRSRPAS